MSNGLQKIMVKSVLGSKSRQGMVEIEMDYPKDHPLQIDPDSARDLAQNLLQAAEAADQEEFLVQYIAKLSGVESEAEQRKIVGMILMEYRQWRIDYRGMDR